MRPRWFVAVIGCAAGLLTSSSGEDARADAPSAPVGLRELAPEIGEDLYPAVALVHQAPQIRGDEFDPVALIRVVNGLHGMGKERALAALRAYRKVAMAERTRKPSLELDPGRIFLVVRLLCVRADGAPGMPTLVLGAPDVQPPEEGSAWPLFPLALQQDLPFLLVHGYMLAGKAEDPLTQIEFCERAGKLRERQLAPRLPPVAAVERLTRSRAWRSLVAGRDPEGQRMMLRLQALRAEGTVSPPSVSGSDRGDEWRRLVHADRARPAKWDTSTQSFVRR